MTLTIDLTPAEEARLAAAARRAGTAPRAGARPVPTTANADYLSQFASTALWTDVNP